MQHTGYERSRSRRHRSLQNFFASPTNLTPRPRTWRAEVRRVRDSRDGLEVSDRTALLAVMTTVHVNVER